MDRSDVSISTMAAHGAAALFLFVATLIIDGEARAEPGATVHQAILVEAAGRPLGSLIDRMPARPEAEPGDDIAALEAVEIALTQASDGAAYVWRRGHGRLSGAVRPKSTFRDADRRICRFIEMEMRLGSYTRRTEGVACRGADGVWLLEG